MRILITETTWASMAVAHDLRQAKFALTTVEDGESFCDFASGGQQDAAVLDANLPDLSAVEALRYLRAHHPVMPVLVLVAKATRSERSALYRAGADAVISATTDPAELACLLRAMILRVHGFCTPTIEAHGLTLDVVRREVFVGAERIPLSPLEYNIVELLVLAHGDTVSRDRVMAHLYGWENEPEQRVLDVYICQIRRKIEAKGGNPRVFETVSGRGFRAGAVALGGLAA